jgi:hypothetical protein
LRSERHALLGSRVHAATRITNTKRVVTTFDESMFAFAPRPASGAPYDGYDHHAGLNAATS